MAVEVALSEPVDYCKLATELEMQELESPGGVATPQIYGQLIIVYLIQNDLPNAKYLWKRIPPSVKSVNPELGQIWCVGQAIWQRDLPQIYEQFRKDWSESVKPLMEVLELTTRKRAFLLVTNGYSSISSHHLSEMLGLPEADAVNMAKSGGWHFDPASSMIHPKKSDNLQSSGITTNHHLSQLTDFVTFLEN